MVFRRLYSHLRSHHLFALLFSCVLIFMVISFASQAGQTIPAAAYEEPLHERLNDLAAQLVELNDTDEIYAEIYDSANIAQLRQGATAEDTQYASWIPTACADGRFMRHFYQPGAGGVNGLPPVDGGARCLDAVTWARSSASDGNSTGGDLTWTGAINNYDYTTASVQQAYLRVGQVAHLIGDMAQPDHVHVHAHPEQDYEDWSTGAFTPPSLSSLSIASGLPRLENYLINMAQITYDASTFQGGALSTTAPFINASSEFAQMFVVEYESGMFVEDQWQLYNRTAAGGRGAHLGNWDGSYGTGMTNRDDEWWETINETGAGGGGRYALEGDIFRIAIPPVYKGSPNSTHLASIYLNAFTPRAIEFIAGMYQHFYEIVNHPPYVTKVTVTQAGTCMYDSHWEDSISDNKLNSRSLEDDCSTDEDDRWINGEDGEVQIVIEFGNNSGPHPVKVQDVQVTVAGQTVDGDLNSDENVWTGSFTPPDDGSMDGEHPVEIIATDKENHFTSRNFAGDELDTDPASPAKAQSAEPYNWQGYEPGTDENHIIKIDTGPLSIRINRDPIGDRCSPQYKVSAEVTENASSGDVGIARVTSSGESVDPASGNSVTVQLGTVGVGGTLDYFVEAEDNAGNIERQEGTVNGPPEPPGCDHSDDNYSAASPDFQVGSVVPLGSEPTRVAVLSNGFAPDASGFINALREPNILVEPDFSPDIVEDYPLLVIPTGGLYGLENSTFFRARLEEYANRGGTIIVFDQQHGADYGVLPGGGLSGYGWAEDNSCTVSSLYIRNYDQVLSGFSDAILNSNVDGYFTSLPANTDILLHRTKNGQPAMVRYPYGSGTVIATTAYDDWGVTNWQTTADAFILNRDLLSWAVDPALLPEYDPGNAVSLPVPVNNETARNATAVRLTLLTPSKQIASEQTQNVAIAAGTTTTLTFNTTAVTPLGIWRVDYTLLDSSGNVIQARTPGERFIVKNPHPLSAPLKEVSFTVNAPTERFFAGSDGVFTFTVFNSSLVTRTLTVRYGLPHHTWETGNAAIYGNFSDLSRTVVVGPESQSQFTHVFPMRTNDRLFAYLYEGGVQKDQTWFQTRKATASVATSLTTAQTEYARGQTVNLTAAITNQTNFSANFSLNMKVTAPDSSIIFSEIRPLPLTASGTTTHTFSFELPTTLPNGSYRVTADVMQQTARVGGAIRNFVLPNSPARFTLTLPDTLPANASDPLQVTVNNPHAYLPANGTFDLAIVDPDGITTTLGTEAYNLTAAQSTVLSFDLTGLPAKFGTYQFIFQAQDQYGSKQWTENRAASATTAVSFDNFSYRVRETVGLNLTVHNSGNFGITPQLTIAIPDLGYNDTQPVLVATGGSAAVNYAFTLPVTLTSGFHDVLVSLDLGSNTSLTERFLVPPADLRPALNDLAYAAGETIVVTLTNSGGVDAPIEAGLQLADKYGLQIASSQPVTTVLAGSSELLTLNIPTGGVSGDYQFRLFGQDTAVGDPFGLHRTVNITGLSGTLAVQTDAPDYFTDENVTALASFVSTGMPVINGSLDLKICRPAPTQSDEPPPPPEDGEETATSLADSNTPLAPEVVGFTAINGSPLIINVATDGSYQVIHDSVNASTPGQVYWTLADIADSGIFLWFDGYVIGPDFAAHPGGSATNLYDPWQNAGQSPVLGSGSPGNPWVLQTDMVHPDSGATMSTQTSYVQGDDFFRMDWEICLPHPANVSTFLAADYYLQGSDNGYGYYDPATGSIGGFNAAQDWFQIFTPIRPASHVYEATYFQIWNAIGSAGSPGPGFNDTLIPSLVDNGAGLQWDVSINSCSTVSAFWSFGETPTIPPVTPPYQSGCGYVLWETTLPLSTTTTLDVSELAGTLDTTGNLLLWGQANSETGQPFAADTYPFQVHDRDTGLTLETDQAIYEPGDTVQISGVVSNTSTLTQSLTLSVTADFDQLILQPLTLAPGESYTYSTNTTATELLGLVASAANARVEAYPLVTEPQIATVLDTPYVVGRDPFQVSLTITNTGIIPVDLTAALVGLISETLTLQPGEAARLEDELSITADTLLIAEITGDITDTLAADIFFGEAAEVFFTPEATYLPGPVSVPYTLVNLGWLSTSFDTEVTLENSDGDTVSSLTIPAMLPVAESVSSSLLFEDLPADTYTLVYTTPFSSGMVSFVVAARLDADLTAVVEPTADTTIPVLATVTNTGADAFSGQVTLQTSFYDIGATVTNLPVGADVEVPLPVDVSAVAAGNYPATLQLTDLGGNLVAETAVTLTVALPDLILTDLPTNLTLPVSTTVTMTFGVANNGGATGQGILSFTFSDIVDEEQVVWLDASEDGTVSFTFFVPPGLEAKTYEATYIFNGEPGILELTVEGVDIDVTPSLDQPAYTEGETAVLNLHITELAGRPSQPLFALVSFNDYSEVQPFTLTAFGSADLSFNVPVSFLGDDKVFYGIYDVASERSIHLNTVYLPRLYPDVTILTDKQVYQPGETVLATVVTTATGQLEVTAPGFADTLTLTGSNTSFSFTLPPAMARGTYTVDGVPQNCGCVNEDQTLRVPFDVAAPEVRVTDAYLNQVSFQPDDTIELHLVVASDQPVTTRFLTWIERPDGSLMTGPEQIVSLTASPVNLLTAVMSLDSDQAGMHRVIYRLVHPSNTDLVYGRGAETFDVGQAVVVAVDTDQTEYDTNGDPVQATVTLYATQAVNGNLEWSVDGGVVHNQNVSLVAGFQQINLTLPGGYGRGVHTLRATLNQGGLTSWRETSFNYATQGADVIGFIAMPTDISNGATQVEVIVGNRGDGTAVASEAVLYDGDPDAGGTVISTLTVPSLGSGASYQAEVPWAVAGQAGPNLLVLMVDSSNAIDETNETNNETEETVTIGLLSYGLSSDQETYYRSDTALLTANLLNLSSTDALTGLSLETTIYKLNGTLTETVLFSDNRPLPDLSAGQTHQEVINWAIADDVADFDVPFLVVQRVLINGQPGGTDSLVAAVIPVHVTIEALPEPGGHFHIYTEIPTVYLEASDTADIYYQWEDEPSPTLYAIPFNATEGARKLFAHPQINGIVVGPTAEKQVSVDMTPPQTTVTLEPAAPDGQNGWYVSPITVTITAVDTGSNVAYIQYGPGDGTWSGYSDPFLVYRDNEYTLYHRGVDWGGNTEPEQLVTFNLDQTPPALVHGGPYIIDEGQSVLLDGSASADATSGLDFIVWDVDGDGTYSDPNPVSLSFANGPFNQTVSLTGSDLAGNGAVTSTQIIVNNVLPTVAAGPDLTINPGDTVNLAPATFSDPGVLDIHTATIDWGDGSSEAGVVNETNGSGTVAGSHVYPDSGTFTVVVTVCDEAGCQSDSFVVTVTGATACDLYPIAIHTNALAGVEVGDIIHNIRAGNQPGKFGWLTWTGNNNMKLLVASLTPPGNSHTYINPHDPTDHVLNVNDWVEVKPGVTDSSDLRAALDLLKTMDITIPIWDVVEGLGSNANYHIIGYANIRLIDYHLAGHSLITVQFQGYATCNNHVVSTTNGVVWGNPVPNAPVAILPDGRWWVH